MAKTLKATAAQQAFALEWLSNGRNATRAYLATHPAAKLETAKVEGHRTLTNPNVQQFIAQEQAGRFKRLQMDGDEAMALIAMAARADLVEAFEYPEDPEAEPRLKPFPEWPEHLRLAVKGIKANGDIVLVDPLKARELVAQAEGRIKTQVDLHHKFDHASYLEQLTPVQQALPAQASKP